MQDVMAEARWMVADLCPKYLYGPGEVPGGFNAQIQHLDEDIDQAIMTGRKNRLKDLNKGSSDVCMKRQPTKGNGHPYKH
jgi:hypothetical protein